MLDHFLAVTDPTLCRVGHGSSNLFSLLDRFLFGPLLFEETHVFNEFERARILEQITLLLALLGVVLNQLTIFLCKILLVLLLDVSNVGLELLREFLHLSYVLFLRLLGLLFHLAQARLHLSKHAIVVLLDLVLHLLVDFSLVSIHLLLHLLLRSFSRLGNSLLLLISILVVSIVLLVVIVFFVAVFLLFVLVLFGLLVRAALLLSKLLLCGLFDLLLEELLLFGFGIAHSLDIIAAQLD